jgi:hypothetical protein
MVVTMKKILVSIIIPSILIATFIGCSSMRTSKGQYVGVAEKLRQQDYDSCLDQIEESKDKFYKEKEKVLFYLDMGMLYHYDGNYEKSNEYLTEAEYAIEDLYTKSVGKAAASMLLNDNALDYFGEDYEDIYLNIFKALNYLHMNKFDDAFVEIRRVNNKLNILEDKYAEIAKKYNESKDKKKEFKIGDNKFQNSALARYLSMLMYKADGKIDDAKIDMAEIEEAFELQPIVYDFSQPELDNYLDRTDKAQLYFLTFVGNSPEKKSNTLWIHTEKDMLIIATSEEVPGDVKNIDPKKEAEELGEATKNFFDAVIDIVPSKKEEASSSSSSTTKPKEQASSTSSGTTKKEIEQEEPKQELATLDIIEWEGMEAGYHFKFPLPYMEKLGTDISRIEVMVDDKQMYELHPLESLENAAFVTYKIKEPLIYLKTITRTVVKGLLAEKGKQEMVNQVGDNLFGKLAMIATDVAVDATENADLRISRFFPSMAYIGNVPIEPGTHSIRINYFDTKNKLVFSDFTEKKDISKDGLNLIESYYLD